MQPRLFYRHPRRRAPGFTLIELMVAVGIVAIIAAVAVPQYMQYVARGRVVEAQGQLAGFGTGLQQYYQDNRTFVGACGATGLAAKPAASAYFTYTCPTLSATGFLIQAAGNAGTSLSGMRYTLDQNGVRATTSVPTGWTGNAGNCWVRSQSGSCN